MYGILFVLNILQILIFMPVDYELSGSTYIKHGFPLGKRAKSMG
jgi:hypothetical protein